MPRPGPVGAATSRLQTIPPGLGSERSTGPAASAQAPRSARPAVGLGTERPAVVSWAALGSLRGTDARKDRRMRVCLFEDRNAPDLEPLALTRPAFDLLCGATPLAAKQLRPFPGAEAGLLVRTHLADVTRLDHPGTPVNDDAWLRRA